MNELKRAHREQAGRDDPGETAVAHPPREQGDRGNRAQGRRQTEQELVDPELRQGHVEEVVERWVRVVHAQELEEVADGQSSGHRRERFVEVQAVCPETPQAEESCRDDECDEDLAGWVANHAADLRRSRRSLRCRVCFDRAVALFEHVLQRTERWLTAMTGRQRVPFSMPTSMEST